MPLPFLLLIIGSIAGWCLIAATFYFGHQMLKDVGIETSDEIIALFPFPLGSRLKALVQNSRYYPSRKLCMIGVWVACVINLFVAGVGVGLIG